MIRNLLAAGVATALFAAPALAQTCGGNYVVQRGDTLSQIADSQYKDARKWSAIYNNNVAKIGDSPNKIRVGQTLSLPCIGGLPTGLSGGAQATTTAAAAAPAKPTGAAALLQAAVNKSTNPAPAPAGGAISKVRLLTADDYAPFTDRKALNGGLFTEVVQATMENSGAEDFGIFWVNDWSAHLDPLLTNAMLDMGFPWFQPDCKQNPDRYRCANFLFSDPMFEMLVLLFVDRRNPMRFTQDDDILGKTLCRPAGYFTHDFDKDGRNWLADGKIKLEQPDKIADCFDLLLEGKVNAVAINEFVGRQALKTLDLEGKVDIVQTRPLSIEGLHVVVHKTHPNAQGMIDTVNGGLDQIKASGDYQGIVDKHMSIFWENL